MDQALRDFLLDYLDDVESLRWQYEATVKAAEERQKNGKPVNHRNLAVAKRHIAFYDHLRRLINGDDGPDQRWEHRYNDIIKGFLFGKAAFTGVDDFRQHLQRRLKILRSSPLSDAANPLPELTSSEDTRLSDKETTLLQPIENQPLEKALSAITDKPL